MRSNEVPIVNDKITELLCQHGFTPDQDLYEFAELIIQECMLAVTREANISGLHLIQNSEMFAKGLVAANGVIKRRFGVE